MAKLTFNGGIHPYDGKDLTKYFTEIRIGISVKSAYWCSGDTDCE